MAPTSSWHQHTLLSHYEEIPPPFPYIYKHTCCPLLIPSYVAAPTRTYLPCPDLFRHYCSAWSFTCMLLKLSHLLPSLPLRKIICIQLADAWVCLSADGAGAPTCQPNKSHSLASCHALHGNPLRITVSAHRWGRCHNTLPRHIPPVPELQFVLVCLSADWTGALVSPQCKWICPPLPKHDIQQW